jgi:acyl dehydratase
MVSSRQERTDADPFLVRSSPMTEAETRTHASLVTNLEDLPQHVGATLGPSSWREVTQEMINLFADATDDHQWIHVDEERAAQGPFGKTIAHGYLTLSLVPPLLGEIFRVEGVSMAINYGLDRLRFPSPVPAGSRVRLVGQLNEVTEVPGGLQVKLTATFEIEGGTKPACVADLLLRFYA